MPQAIVRLHEEFTELTIQAIVEKIGKLKGLSSIERSASGEIILHTKHGDQPQIWTDIRSRIDKIIAAQPIIPDPKAGDELYVPATDHNSGGLAVISRIEPGTSAGETVDFARFEGFNGTKFNLRMLLQEQAALKKNYRSRKAVWR